MGTLFYLLGIGLAGFAGVSGQSLVYIPVSCALMIVGYFFIRAPQMYNIFQEHGIFMILKIIISQIFVYSIITAPTYFIARLFS